MGHVVNGMMYVWAYPDPDAPNYKNPNDITDHVDPDRASWPARGLDHSVIQDSSKEVVKARFPGDTSTDPNGPWYIVRYDSLTGLILSIGDLLRTETWVDHNDKVRTDPSLRILEIFSHGTQDRCGGLTAATVGAFATQFDYLTTADNVDIFLSGCLTGCRKWDGASKGIESKEPNIAELLADQLPGPKHRPLYRVTVWGTKGEQTGSHAGGNSKTAAFEVLSDGYLEGYPRQEHAEQKPGVDPDPTYYPFRGPYSQ